MPRPHRLDFQGAIHYVRVCGRAESNIFFEPAVLTRNPKDWWSNAPHVRNFLQLLSDPLAECGAQLYAYSVEPNVASLLVQTLGAPVDRFMQRVCGSFSRHWHAAGTHAGERRSAFAQRYESKVIAPEYVPHAVRRVHAAPYAAGLRWPSMSYPFSSERAYLGGRSYALLHGGVVEATLEEKGFVGLHGYREFMALPESAYVARLFENGSPEDARIVGSRTFVMQARDRVAHPEGAPTREQLIAGVAASLRVETEEIFGATHRGVLGRSLVAWYGLRMRAATLSEMARWFSVSAATLGRGIRYYRRRAPEYFASRALPGWDFEAGTGSLEKAGGDV
jgi:hypothetical protein